MLKNMKTQLLVGRGFAKNEAEWTRKAKTEQEESPGSGQSMCGDILRRRRREKEICHSVAVTRCWMKVGKETEVE